MHPIGVNGLKHWAYQKWMYIHLKFHMAIQRKLELSGS